MSTVPLPPLLAQFAVLRARSPRPTVVNKWVETSRTLHASPDDRSPVAAEQLVREHKTIVAVPGIGSVLYLVHREPSADCGPHSGIRIEWTNRLMGLNGSQLEVLYLRPASRSALHFAETYAADQIRSRGRAARAVGSGSRGLTSALLQVLGTGTSYFVRKIRAVAQSRRRAIAGG